jgi:hypothetical protein
VETRLDEVAWLLSVCEDGLIAGDGSGAVAGVLGEVCHFEVEEIVMGKLIGETFLHDEGLGIAGVVTEEEGEGGARFDGGDDAVSSRFAEKLEAFFLVAAYAGYADKHTDETREARYSKLLDSYRHLGVGVIGVDPQDLLAVVARGEALPGGGDVAVIDQGDKGGVHAACIAARKVGVGVVGVGLDLLIGQGDGGVGEGFDAVADGLGNGNVTFGGEKGIVGVVGGIEEVLTVELTEDNGEEDVADGDDALWVGALDGLKAGEGTVVVEDVEVLEGFTDLRGKIDRVSVGGGIVRLRVGGCPKGEDDE